MDNGYGSSDNTGLTKKKNIDHVATAPHRSIATTVLIKDNALIYGFVYLVNTSYKYIKAFEKGYTGG